MVHVSIVSVMLNWEMPSKRSHSTPECADGQRSCIVGVSSSHSTPSCADGKEMVLQLKMFG